MATPLRCCRPLHSRFLAGKRTFFAQVAPGVCASQEGGNLLEKFMRLGLLVRSNCCLPLAVSCLSG